MIFATALINLVVTEVFRRGCLSHVERSAYQFYTDKTGKLLSSDFIIDQGENDNYGVSFYYWYL